MIISTLSPFLNDTLHDTIFHHLIFTEPLTGRNNSVDAEELERLICSQSEISRDSIKNPINAIQEASKICEIDEEVIISLAKEMAKKRTMISVSWSLTRQDHGEQPFWAAIMLASMIGQIGLPGGGFGFGYRNYF